MSIDIQDVPLPEPVDVKKIYVVIESSGEYEDFQTTNVIGFKKIEDALHHVEVLTAWDRQHAVNVDKLNKMFSEWRKKNPENEPWEYDNVWFSHAQEISKEWMKSLEIPESDFHRYSIPMWYAGTQPSFYDVEELEIR